jgi:hypothetical protein
MGIVEPIGSFVASKCEEAPPERVSGSLVDYPTNPKEGPSGNAGLLGANRCC